MGIGDGITAMIRLGLVGLACLISVAAAAETQTDPFETLNRKSQNLNDAVDKRLMRPVARGYSQLLPLSVRRSIGRVYGNLQDIGDAVNNLLQGKPGAFFSDVVRVGINTTIGLGGMFDPAIRLGLNDHDEDFAQTLAKWGVSRGPYLVIPFLGPSSLRDVFARSINNRVDSLLRLRPINHRNAVYVARFVHTRADLLGTDKVVFGDRYLFFREAYLQRRQYLELDGQIVADPFGNDFDEL